MEYADRAEVERIGRAGALWYEKDGTVIARALSSFWLHCEREDNAFTPWMKTDGFWEAWITRWMSNRFPENDHFIDVGANVGYYSMAAAKSGLHVTAYEPNPVVADLLERAAKHNRVEINLQRLALSNRAGKKKLAVPEGHSGGGHLAKEGIAVQASTLDKTNAMVGQNILMKIDAEGAEPLIWAGGKETRGHNRVTTILEWDSSRFDADKFATELFDNHSVRLVNYDGNEEEISKDTLVNGDGIHMIVVR
ncbi:methyltransferase [Streptomyces phage Muntaha]|uniref:Methyltransferase n=1 Tax=Streptomyces phage Muntaha TaxID=2713269 RepID=A0A6G8R353_9CAUD|nr:methyltransferase [Streptomyces phage Muntaha]QIN94629.1 methyltransferase [Streptomyces phage Muntaha]